MILQTSPPAYNIQLAQLTPISLFSFSSADSYPAQTPESSELNFPCFCVISISASASSCSSATIIPAAVRASSSGEARNITFPPLPQRTVINFSSGFTLAETDVTPSTCSITDFNAAASSGTTGGGVAEFMSTSIASLRTHCLFSRVYVIEFVESVAAGTSETRSITALGSSSETIAKNIGCTSDVSGVTALFSGVADATLGTAGW